MAPLYKRKQGFNCLLLNEYRFLRTIYKYDAKAICQFARRVRGAFRTVPLDSIIRVQELLAKL